MCKLGGGTIAIQHVRCISNACELFINFSPGRTGLISLHNGQDTVVLIVNNSDGMPGRVRSLSEAEYEGNSVEGFSNSRYEGEALMA